MCKFIFPEKKICYFGWKNAYLQLCKNIASTGKNVSCLVVGNIVFFCCHKILFCLQLKCGHHKKVVWPWLVEQIQPTLTELGVPTPEALGYDKPELYLKKTEEF